MKLKLQTLTDPNFLGSFQKLCQLPLTLAESLALARAARAIDIVTADFNTARLAFFKAHGTREGDGYRLDPARTELIAEYHAEMAGFLAEEIDLPLPQPIHLPSECQLTAAEIFPLLDLIEA